MCCECSNTKTQETVFFLCFAFNTTVLFDNYNKWTVILQLTWKMPWPACQCFTNWGCFTNQCRTNLENLILGANLIDHSIWHDIKISSIVTIPIMKLQKTLDVVDYVFKFFWNCINWYLFYWADSYIRPGAMINVVTLVKYVLTIGM